MKKYQIDFQNNDNFIIRNGLKDEWNASFVIDAKFTKNDIPICPTRMKTLPKDIITYEEAKTIFKQKMLMKNKNFHMNGVYVSFYIDDQKFDSIYGIWARPKQAIKILSHFDGIITPDFSTYADFPYPIKIYNTYRMRAFGFYMYKLGFNVINNVRFGTEETYGYCFDGIEKNSIIAIGTVASRLKLIANQYFFEKGLKTAVETLKPKTIIIYGSANYPCFKKTFMKGIKVIAYDSQTCKFFKNRYNKHE